MHKFFYLGTLISLIAEDEGINEDGVQSCKINKHGENKHGQYKTCKSLNNILEVGQFRNKHGGGNLCKKGGKI